MLAAQAAENTVKATLKKPEGVLARGVIWQLQR
jgi:hypothetical protein